MTKVKAFIFAGDYHQYIGFVKDNHLDTRAYPMLDEWNWRGVHGADVIRVGTYYTNSRMLDMLPHIEFYVKRDDMQEIQYERQVISMGKKGGSKKGGKGGKKGMGAAC